MRSASVGRLRGLFFGLSLLLGSLGNAIAQPLEDVSLEFQNQGIVATIRLSGPVQYLRHFPESHGKTLEIYYNRIKDASSSEPWLDEEVRHSPPSSLIPSFTVTTRDQQTNPRLVIEFSREAEYSVAAGKDGRSLLVTIRPEKRPVSTGPLPLLPTIPVETKPAAGAALTGAAATAAETNKQARALFIQAHDALAANNNEAAVSAYNKLLMLPPNDYTQEGQEWVGVARERSGQPDKAKVEYELYLRLYPEGAGAARVAQRLEGLAGKVGGAAPLAAVTDKRQAASLMTFGSLSTHYYYGRSQISNTNTFNGATTTDKLSLTDTSLLVTTVDVSERYRTEDYDSRLVLRDVNTRNFLSNQPSLNRLNAAYGEIKGRTQNYFMRVGRQSSTGAGVLGRFDGVNASYGDPQDFRVNAVGGAVADYWQGGKPHFFGASVDKGIFSFYGMGQTVEGMTDRRAVGTELRYFDDRRSAYGLLDYDTYFKAVNAAQFMGMTKLDGATPSGATLSFMLDHRKVPSLSIRNALLGAATSSVSALAQTMSASAVRDLAVARTSTSNMGQVGITMPVSEKWQVGGDLRVTNTTGMGATGQTTTDPVTGLPTCQNTGSTVALQGCVQSNPGLGLQKSVTGQLIGSGLAKQGDIWSGSVTYSTGGTAKGHSFFLYNHTQFVNGWMTDLSLAQSTYNDQYGGTTTQIMPMLRGTYRFKERFSIDGDLGYQKIDYNGPQTTTRTTRLFGSAGVRWDF